MDESLKQVASYFSRLHREMFGRGPSHCQAFLEHQVLVIQVTNFISSLEEVLLDQGQMDIAAESRMKILQSLISEMKGVLRVLFQSDVLEVYHDWSYENGTGIVIVLFQLPIENVNFLGKEKLHQEVARLSALTERTPAKILSVKINAHLIVVERDGILIPLEKAMIQKGYATPLRTTKAELEKKYFHRDGHFHEIFQESVQDIFIDWNLQTDRSLVCFVLNTVKG
ncbi:Na-translocating system protein MpsC family protein [Alicyclobacillus tolerans]|uniref:Na-translocating system protein MpsC family protein n=1 Tax=Alicyclobacillus tolerans TaxID=90970 RepID=UPI003B7AA139